MNAKIHMLFTSIANESKKSHVSVKYMAKLCQICNKNVDPMTFTIINKETKLHARGKEQQYTSHFTGAFIYSIPMAPK